MRVDYHVQINTSGLHKPVNEIFPSGMILARCSEYGIPVTFGSDAHKPSEVGRDLSLAYEMAERCGYGEISVFHRHRRIEVPLTGSSD